MATPIPTKNCRHCGVSLEGIKRNGARCMKCYSQVIMEKRRSLKEKAVEYKGNKCCKCGGSFHQAVYDFHHIDGSTKDACIGHMTHNCRPWTVIQEELDKCEMLCANCHRVEHFV